MTNVESADAIDYRATNEAPNRRYVWLIGPLMLVGVIVFALTMIPRNPASDSADAGFARDMAVHHMQAVEMAEIIRDRTTDPTLKTLATDISLTQQAQIGQFRGWLEAWGLPLNRPGPIMEWAGHSMETMPGVATRSEVNKLKTVSQLDAETQFLQLMIRHHEGGVDMAEAALERAGEGEVMTLARAIVKSQQAEIATMTHMLSDRNAAPLDSVSDTDH